MTHSLSDIKRLLAEITQAELDYTYDGSSDWTVGEAPDPQAKPIYHLWSKNDEWARAHVKFASLAPTIIKDLVEQVVEQRKQIDDLKKENDNYSRRISDCYLLQDTAQKESRKYLSEIKDLTLRLEAATNVISRIGHTCHTKQCLCKASAAMDVEEEFQRLREGRRND